MQATEYWKRKTRNLIDKIKHVNIEDAQLG